MSNIGIFLGDDTDHIKLEAGTLEFVTSGQQLLRLSADPDGGDIIITGPGFEIASKTYVDERTINNLAAQTANYSVNSYKLTELADATLNTDALNRQTADSRFYQNNVTLDSITVPVDSVSLNSQKIINLANPVLNTDATNKTYVDTQISNLVNSAPGLLDTLKELADALGNDPDFAATITNSLATKLPLAGGNMTGIINMQTYKIENLGDCSASTDALNRQSGDSRYYQQTATLDAITLPIASVSLDSQKITNLADATLSTDALNRQTADSRYYQTTQHLNNIIAPNADLSINSYKITNLATPVLSTDATNKNYVDSNFYQNTTVLNSITAPTGSLSLNSQKITTLATCTNANDAANKTYVDTAISTYVLQQLRTRYATMSITVGNMLAASSDQLVFTQPFPTDYPSLISSIYRTYVDTYSCRIAITYVSATLNLQNYKVWACIRGTGVSASNPNNDNFTASIFNSTTNVLTLSWGGSGAFGNQTVDCIVDIILMLKTDV